LGCSGLGEKDFFELLSLHSIRVLYDLRGNPDTSGRFSVKPLIIVKGKSHDEKITLGEMRNLGVQACRGEFVVVWDDDDLYSCRRVEVQVKAAQEPGYAASTFDSLVTHETEQRSQMTGKERRSYLMHRRFKEVTPNGVKEKSPIGWEPTLCCKRELMLKNKYLHLNTGEDTPVLEAIWKTGKLNVIPHGIRDAKMYIYMRQGKPTANCDENEWYDLRQIKYDFSDVLQFALEMQHGAHSGFGLAEAVLRPFLSWGSTRFPRPPPCGYLTVKDGNIVGESGEPAQLHGVSLFWSNWKPKYWKYDTIAELKNDWRVNLIRAPVAVEKEDGYLELEEVNTERIDDVVRACLALGLYVIVDWHSHNVYHNDASEAKAIEFFRSMAQKYGKFPHVIFETWNEPEGRKDMRIEWPKIKKYHEKVVRAIRDQGASNLIVVSGPDWASISDEMLANPLSNFAENGPIALSLHAYFKDRRELDGKKKQANAALSSGYPVMVTEWGVGPAEIKEQKDPKDVKWKDEEQICTKEWVAFLKEKKLSHAVWAISDKCELHSLLMPNAPSNKLDKEPDATKTLPWNVDLQLTPVGKYIRNMHREYMPDEIKDFTWIKRCGLPFNADGSSMEGDNHPGIVTQDIQTLEEMKKACMSHGDCVGFAYRPAQSKGIDQWGNMKYPLAQVWYPKKVGGFNPNTAIFSPHPENETWEWYYCARTAAQGLGLEAMDFHKDQEVNLKGTLGYPGNFRAKIVATQGDTMKIKYEDEGFRTFARKQLEGIKYEADKIRAGIVCNKWKEDFGDVVLWNVDFKYTGTKIPNGDVVIILETEGDEYKVVWHGQQGWIKSHHIRRTVEAELDPSTFQK